MTGGSDADRQKKADRLHLLIDIADSVAGLILVQLNQKFDYRGRFLVNSDALNSVNKIYWRTAQEFKEYHGFKSNKINNPKIAAISLYALSNGRSIFTFEGESPLPESYNEYTIVKYSIQI